MSYTSSPTSKLFQLTALTLSLALAGCGGGDGTDTIAPKPDIGLVTVIPSNQESGSEEESTIQASEIYILSNYTSINVDMAKDTSIKIEALVLDDKNGVVSDKTVTFAITDPKATGLFSTSSSRVTTDEKGKAVIELQATSMLTAAQRDFLIKNGLTVRVSVDGVEQSITIFGIEGNTNTQKDDVYDVFISSDKTELLTGTDKTTVNIRVTDKKGGIVEGVPVIISITDAARYGLSLNSASKQFTDEQGLIAVELVQSRVSIDSQINHESLLTVIVDDDDNSIVEQSFPIIVSGTRASNVISSKNVVSSGENFSVSGQLLDGAASPISRADVVLYSNDVEATIGSTDSDGNFRFNLNTATLNASSDDSYVFSIEIKGAKNTQRIPNILTVGTAISSNMSFEQTTDIAVNTREKITLNVPDGIDGDSVVIVTNKGKVFASTGESENVGSSRRLLTVMNRKVEFYIESSVPDSATITATHKRTGQPDNIKETVLNFVSISPTKLLLQTERSILSIGGSTQVIARVLDNDNAPVKNAIVQFTTTKDASGGSLGKGVAYTDSSGIAKVFYNAGQNPTQTDGVVIEAEVRVLELPDGTEKSVNVGPVETKISIQTRATFISFAFANKISAGDRQVYYYQKGSISVLNSTGKPAINQPVSINLNPSSYGKGKFFVDKDIDGEKFWNRRTYRTVFFPDSSTIEYGPYITCNNEDTNNNGILDLGEDVNGNNQLDPINVAAVLDKDGNKVDSSQSFNFITDNAGKVDFSIRYPKEYAEWYRAKVTVNTSVDGSESQQSRLISFPSLIDDVDIGIPLRPNLESPFGVNPSCSNFG
ncbi:Ig-like domain-containing protein [Psychrobacter sp. Pi2-52]|uniref:Ig-like domain-containing protein n=1 Tax=Psychrobacter sp. Pi2-52 TaxID=2774133 RepID=UPI00191B2A0C|nr:Ig-like domain-containing protein [Psychrobacter sp. Pi2-52]